MDSNALSAALALVIALIPGVVVPWAAMRAILRHQRSGPMDLTNYRGIRIQPTLGLVWPVWAVGLLAAQALVDVAARLLAVSGAGAGVLGRIADTPLTLPLFGVPFLLVTGAFAFGLIDDAFGAGGPKGFGGHLAALRAGTLTTGMLKLLGIGSLAIYYGASAAPGTLERSGLAARAEVSVPLTLLAWGLAAAVIALAANLLNLLDLRPGRALKAYSALVTAPAVFFGLSVVASFNDSVTPLGAGIGGLALGSTEASAVALGMAAVALGPVLAVWRFDLGERAMLGDSGANAAGVVVGYLLTAVLGLGGLAAAAIVLLALNLLSERVSFSAVIERVPLLSWLDRLGRAPGDPEGHAAPSGSVPYTAEVRYDADGGDPTIRED